MKVDALSLHARCANGIFSLHARCTSGDALSPTTRCTDGALYLHGRCGGVVLRKKDESLRPFSKVD